MKEKVKIERLKKIDFLGLFEYKSGLEINGCDINFVFPSGDYADDMPYKDFKKQIIDLYKDLSQYALFINAGEFREEDKTQILNIWKQKIDKYLLMKKLESKLPEKNNNNIKGKKI